MRLRALFTTSWLLLAAASVPLHPATAVADATAAGVGLARFSLTDPENGGPMGAAVFYPATVQTEPHQIGPFQIDAEIGARPEPGRHPLVLISHGHAGSRLGHHDLDGFLARHGYIVAAIEHPGDNFQDTSGVGTTRVLLGRARQVSALLTALMADSRFGPLVDPEKVGVAGFSAGGYTALLLAGARPNFERFARYCRTSTDGNRLCDFDASAWTPPKHPEPGSLTDPRIRAAFVMSPLAVVFGPEDLRDISIPVFLYYAKADAVLVPAANAERIIPLIPSLAGSAAVPDAGHMVFLAPCTAKLSEEVPNLCQDPPGVDRKAVHATVNAAAVTFFEKALAPHGATTDK